MSTLLFCTEHQNMNWRVLCKNHAEHKTTNPWTSNRGVQRPAQSPVPNPVAYSIWDCKTWRQAGWDLPLNCHGPQIRRQTFVIQLGTLGSQMRRKERLFRCFEALACGYLLELLGHGCCYLTLWTSKSARSNTCRFYYDMMQLIMPEILACPGQIHVLLHHRSNKPSCAGSAAAYGKFKFQTTNC
jgi:hypothetical protein